MLRYISIFLLVVSIMSCEKEPLECELIGVQPLSDTSFVFVQLNTPIIGQKDIYGWDSFKMPIYQAQWESTNPTCWAESCWIEWATDSTNGVMNAEPDYIIRTFSPLSNADWSTWNGDYYITELILADRLALGDTIIIL